MAAADAEVAGLAVVTPSLIRLRPIFRHVLEASWPRRGAILPGVGGDLADPDAREVAYDRLPVPALLSMSRGLETLRPRLVDVGCSVLILTSRHNHVVAPVTRDVLAGAVSGPVARVSLERGHHLATLDLDRHELKRRVVDFAHRAVAGPVRSELGDAPEGQEQTGGDDARRGQQR